MITQLQLINIIIIIIIIIIIAGAAGPGVNYMCRYGVTRLPFFWRTTPLHWIFTSKISRYKWTLVCRTDISKSDWTFRLLTGQL